MCMTMETKTNVRKYGESYYLLLSPDVVRWLGVEAGDEMVIEDKDGKKGRFIAAWKKE